MVNFQVATLALLASRAMSQAVRVHQYQTGGLKADPVSQQAQEIIEDKPDDLGSSNPDAANLKSPNLKVEISTSFPQAEIFGVKLVNGHATRALLDIANHEPLPITLQVVGGALTTPIDVPGAPMPPQVLRNLSATQYGLQIPAGESETVTYSFATELHPQDLRLNLLAVLSNSEGKAFSRAVYNETVSVVEAPVSFFDPQMYAHLPAPIPHAHTDRSQLPASSSTSSSPPPSAASATSSTTLGSPRSSLRNVGAAKAASARNFRLVGVRRSNLRIRRLLLVRMDLR